MNRGAMSARRSPSPSIPSGVSSIAAPQRLNTAAPPAPPVPPHARQGTAEARPAERPRRGQGTRLHQLRWVRRWVQQHAERHLRLGERRCREHGERPRFCQRWRRKSRRRAIRFNQWRGGAQPARRQRLGGGLRRARERGRRRLRVAVTPLEGVAAAVMPQLPPNLAPSAACGADSAVIREA